MRFPLAFTLSERARESAASGSGLVVAPDGEVRVR
jgi:hypothetical protein